jgi:hypothetical protein
LCIMNKMQRLESLPARQRKDRQAVPGPPQNQTVRLPAVRVAA